MKVKVFRSAFVVGELSPDLYGRSDTEIYSKAVAKARNTYPLPQGSLKRREGTRYIEHFSQMFRLVDFEFNTEQVYCLVFLPGRMRVYRNRVFQVEVTSGAVGSLTAAQIQEMTFVQSVDTLLLFHRDLQPIRITRTSHTSWTVNNLTLSNIPVFDYGSGNEPVISGTRGWPRCAAFKYGRLWLAGLRSRPQTILASKVGEFFDLNKGTGLDDEGINFTIDDDRVNAILNIFPGRSLQFFTTGGEFAIAGSGQQVTPSNIADLLQKATLHGSETVRPLSIDGATIFVEAGGNTVRQFVYSDLEQSYNAPNISRLSAHLIRSPQRMTLRRANKKYPSDFVYMVNADGTMAVLSYVREERVNGWSLFETDGFFRDVVTVGNDVYVQVERMIQGQPAFCLELLDESCKTDCATFQTSVNPAVTWLNLSYLNGRTVKVFGDDYLLQDRLVSGGSITTELAVRQLETGLTFVAQAQLLPVEVLLQGGQSTAGQWKRLISVGLHLKDSRGVVVKRFSGGSWQSAWRHFGQAVLNAPVSLFTGWKKLYLAGIGRDVQVDVTQDDPLEFELLAAQVEVGV